MTKQYKGGYDRQSVLSAAGKLSCNKTALKRCTRTELLLLLLLLHVFHVPLYRDQQPTIWDLALAEAAKHSHSKTRFVFD